MQLTDNPTGNPFRMVSGSNNFVGPQTGLGRQQIYVDMHPGAGETVTLEVESPGSVWIDTGIAFSDIGVKAFWDDPTVRYRMRTTAPGARAYATGVWRVE